jgi:hypothetical protein
MDDYRRKDKDAGQRGIDKIGFGEAHADEATDCKLLQFIVFRLVSSAKEAEEEADQSD